ncbi:pyrimidine (deoxy)nucleoside triphosphate diphosphatase [Cronobacter malonaticus]|uniref:Pyrimidine (Deoxy)nucleoside triphosphate diphosphatase n=2 Tax=Cronobacter TaxID=413496 RepID=V5U040_9ENTR|nr:pyrimidine (deoxy)nucleoside triphosphate diphosphatase [Cronobacter malonaticus]AHB70743.1 pyrimidine (deoxy)nucleoside triphosphate pyrophosphohydrolase [Cronobacter malonaticus]ALX78955.1 NTP pyrophosphohydrolase [Cronobacter malonaticus LMG 23826]EGT4278064.1 pyrimidine (deoxy)nucleoside triphosphate diphosphatase [Cronobacter malonaticus]EGT4287439.1 pyrimidine (deoxy)nucleoside triphosphate diphosphatase [Cronobacter malonaticus]EGT4295180.1 pyrimidine (deoxy)nucleoside triphosphate d
MQIIDVVAAIIVREGRLLLAQRSPDGDQPGLWEFPGGKVEPGESQPAALARELTEELAISARIGPYVASHTREVSGRVIRLHAWQVDDFDGEPQALCHSALVWCAPREAFDYALAPADIPLLEAFMSARDATPADSC